VPILQPVAQHQESRISPLVTTTPASPRRRVEDDQHSRTPIDFHLGKIGLYPEGAGHRCPPDEIRKRHKSDLPNSRGPWPSNQGLNTSIASYSFKIVPNAV
jgi:hypothetical protein